MTNYEPMPYYRMNKDVYAGGLVEYSVSILNNVNGPFERWTQIACLMYISTPEECYDRFQKWNGGRDHSLELSGINTEFLLNRQFAKS